MSARAILLAVVALALLPAAAQAASWSAPQALTRSGQAFAPAVATGTNGGVAIAYVRQLGSTERAELRNGTLSGRLRAPVVLDSSTHLVANPAVAIAIDGRAVVAWQRYLGGNHRIRATSVRRDGHVGPIRTLTDGGESAYGPAFSPATDLDRHLWWTRRTFSQTAPFANGRFEPPTTFPFAGISGDPVAAVEVDGTLVAVWVADRRILTAEARPGQPFSPPRELAPRGSKPRLALSGDGTMIAAWTTPTGVVGASRPARGEFGAPTALTDGPAVAAKLIAGAARDMALAWVDADRHLRLQRLTLTAQRVGAAIDLGGDDVTLDVALAADPSAVYAAWSVRSSGIVRARRIAPAGIIGPVRTIAPRSPLNGHAPVIGAGAIAWIDGSKLLLSRYR
jgi:hypothetical protein